MRRLIVLLIFLLPLLSLIIMGEEGLGVNPLLVLVILLVLCFAAGAFMGAGTRGRGTRGRSREETAFRGSYSVANERDPTFPFGEWVECRRWHRPIRGFITDRPCGRDKQD
jgi:hypothetical protein